jgi:two-component system, OmpR family, phosphate regulon response regulator PhoB
MTRHGHGHQASQRILLADADTVDSDRLARALREQGYAVEIASDAHAVHAAAERAPPDLVVLELALPTPAVGWEVLARMRDLGLQVIVHSTQAGEADRIVGLELGADDYVPKHCSPRELIARVRAVLRRVHHPASGVQRLVYDGLVIDTRARKVFVDGREVTLRPREFDLLAFLAAAPGQAFSRLQLLEQVWASSAEWQSPDTVTEHVRRLRLAIEADPSRPRRLVTVRGVGYRFEP